MFRKIIFLIFLLGLALSFQTKEISVKENRIELQEKVSLPRFKKKEEYGRLKINKIALNRELFPLKSKENKIEKNIELLHRDEKKKNTVLVAHSGKGYNAFFNDLDKLEKNDTVELIIKKEKSTYRLIETELIQKEKINSLKLDKNGHNLLLITCDKSEKDKFLLLKLALQK